MQIESMVLAAYEAGASDIHLACGLPPKYRLHGQLLEMDGSALGEEDCLLAARELAGNDFVRLESEGQLDLARTIGGKRVRINIFRQMGRYSVALRLLSENMPRITELGLPPVIESFASLPRGLVLITGETGSGKSTTLAALIDKINQTRREHILTLEDPVEYIYAPAQCLINQREIGRDAVSFAEALKAALREDPDVILIGEMRDTETIEIALTAAETGHLVFATLHTGSAPDAIDRVVGVFPAARQPQIRMQLSMTLRAVVSQQLLPRKDGRGRVCACEIMVVTPAVRNLIREGKTPQIANSLATAASEGSVTMDNSLIRLYKEGKISPETAAAAAHDAEYVGRGVSYAR